MSQKMSEDLLITISYLKFVILSITIIMMILIIINGSNTETLLGEYKVGYLETNLKALNSNSSMTDFVKLIWKYLFELFLGILGIISLIKKRMGLYFFVSVVAMAFANSIKTEIVIIIGCEILMQIIYFVQKKQHSESRII